MSGEAANGLLGVGSWIGPAYGRLRGVVSSWEAFVGVDVDVFVAKVVDVIGVGEEEGEVANAALEAVLFNFRLCSPPSPCD